jgi:hypothetical protein
MNIFEKKLKETKAKGLPTNPIELYQRCDYQAGYEYLRGIQEEVLKQWEKIRDQRDVICKMNTGSGKTLTGLLMLYSKMIENKEPVLYLCPDNQLVNQTLDQAALYGIPVCTFETGNTELPSDFVNSKKILVCNVFKLFNGKSVFNKQEISINAIVIDDAHKCVDTAREQSSLVLDRSHSISKRLFDLLSPALKKQLEGSFLRLKDGDPYISMKVPYWAWLDHQSEVVAIINEEVTRISDQQRKAYLAGKPQDKDNSPFKWNVMADNLVTYDCYFSGNTIEITPVHVPYQFFKPFNEASHRYILSATFEDDYDLIKDFGIAYESIIKPIIPSDRKDVGKRLILTPNRFDARITENELRDFISEYPDQGYNVVVLVPSAERAKLWTRKGAELFMSENIHDALENLESSTGNFIVLANRYDGMDLKGDACRILVLDGLPAHNSIQDFYAETRLDNLKAGRKVQIIEQGLGRAVRSGGDHCVVFLMGTDLLGFLAVEKNLKYFTPVTRAQVTLGLDLLTGVESKDSLETIRETAKYALKQDKKWTSYHAEKMQEVTADSVDQRKELRLKLAEGERKALLEFRLRKYVPASEIILREIVEVLPLNSKEKGWYYQFAGQLAHLGDRVKANEHQAKAYLHSSTLHHPPLGYQYNKAAVKGAQTSLIKTKLAEFERPQDILNYVQSLLQDLVYSPEKSSREFEIAIAKIGEFLGFDVQMPESDLGDGPDGLWMAPDGHAFILEAKSNRKPDNKIAKGDIEQLMQSETWFKERYGADAPYTAVTLQANPTKNRDAHVDGQHVLDQVHLELLHRNLIEFCTALQTTNPKAHTEDELLKLLPAYKLTSQLFRSTYLTKIK